MRHFGLMEVLILILFVANCIVWFHVSRTSRKKNLRILSGIVSALWLVATILRVLNIIIKINM